jgi:predicted ATPase/class 3 adenylate cyclase/predicted negative regulator of RcsB-dependent stress response
MGEIVTLLLTDIVDSTRTTQQLGEGPAIALWAEHDRRARDLLRRHRGREIDRADGFLLLFDTAANAARYALAYHAALSELGLAARCGMHVGAAVLRHASAEDVALGAKPVEIDGLAKPLAARVMALARGGQTLLTAAARDALGADAVDASWQLQSHGWFQLKGIDEPVEVFELGVLAQCSFTPPSDTDKAYRVIRLGELWQPVRSVPRHLPAERDVFVGRTSDLRAIASRFDAGTRLLTLLGPGGIGKTRLAVRYGHAWIGDWPGGVWFCDLSEASTIDGIHYAAGRTMGVRLGGGGEQEQLAQAIAGRGRCLVILDNFEQVAAHAPATVGRWLDGAPEASFLVTSRERLNLAGEVVQAVDSLAPNGSAVELFLVRARAHRTDFAIDAAQRAVIGEITGLLDGLPLAIELAAARIAVLSPAQLLLRLRDRFQLLAARGAKGRQATMRATIDWSWQLLSAWEQATLEQCSVFEGGFTIAASEAVVDLSQWPEAPAVIDVVHALVDKSLLRRWIPASAPTRHDLDEPYFGMYLSIHEYAAEKRRLRGDASERALEERHGRYFARFGSDEEIEALSTHRGLQRQHALRHELDNLVAACRHAVARRDGAVATACYRAAWEVLALQGPFGIAVTLGAEVTAIEGLDVRLVEAARLSHAESLMRVGAAEGLETRLLEALDRVRAVGERKLEGRVLGRLGNICLWEGRLADARERYHDALTCFRDVRSRLLEARMLGNLAIVAHEQGHPGEALAHYEAALAIEREIGSERDEAITLCNLADLQGGQGLTERARETFDAALERLRELGDRDTEAVTLQQFGEFELGQGRIDEALAKLHAALDLTREIGNRRVQAFALRSIGEALLEQGEIDAAREAFDEVMFVLRAAPNRRIEAHAKAGLAALAHREGRIGDAAGQLADAEATLRELEERPLLADLLCTRVIVELARGDRGAAAAALAEAERIAIGLNAGAGSAIGRRIARVREALAR